MEDVVASEEHAPLALLHQDAQMPSAMAGCLDGLERQSANSNLVTLAQLPANGAGVELIQNPQPFANAAELLLYYDSLSYMSYGRLDEFRWLAQSIEEAIVEGDDNRDQVSALRENLARGEEV